MSVVLSKCEGTDCKKKSTCLRYTLEPLPKWQPYLVMSVSIKDVDACRWHISNEPEEKLDTSLHIT